MRNKKIRSYDRVSSIYESWPRILSVDDRSRFDLETGKGIRVDPLFMTSKKKDLRPLILQP